MHCGLLQQGRAASELRAGGQGSAAGLTVCTGSSYACVPLFSQLRKSRIADE